MDLTEGERVKTRRGIVLKPIDIISVAFAITQGTGSIDDTMNMTILAAVLFYFLHSSSANAVEIESLDVEKVEIPQLERPPQPRPNICEDSKPYKWYPLYCAYDNSGFFDAFEPSTLPQVIAKSCELTSDTNGGTYSLGCSSKPFAQEFNVS